MLNIEQAFNVDRECRADPALRKNMLEQGFIYLFLDKWHLTAKGRHAMEERMQAAIKAREQGLTQPSDYNRSGEELPPNLEGK